MEDIRCEGERGRGREEGTRDGGAYVEGRVCGICGEGRRRGTIAGWA